MSYNINNKHKNQAKYNYPLLFILGFFILALLANLVKLVNQYRERQQILTSRQQKLAKTKEQQERLKYELRYSETEEYIEKEARKLTLSKKNEFVVIVPSLTPKPKLKSKKIPDIANYKLWLALFIK